MDATSWTLRRIILLSLSCSGLLVAAAARAEGPAGYAHCSDEKHRCNFGGTKDVAYGAHGKFFYMRRVRGGIDCNNGIFGDPISNVFKACYISDPDGGLPEPHEERRGSSIDGKWSSDFGVLNLSEGRHAVNGTYDFKGGRFIDSRRVSNVLSGRWVQDKAEKRCDYAIDGSHFHGRFTFEFSERGFVGKYGYCDEVQTGNWNGRRGH